MRTNELLRIVGPFSNWKLDILKAERGDHFCSTFCVKCEKTKDDFQLLLTLIIHTKRAVPKRGGDSKMTSTWNMFCLDWKKGYEERPTTVQ